MCGETGLHRREVQEGPHEIAVGTGIDGKGSEVRRGLLEIYSKTERRRRHSRREGVYSD